MNLAYRWLSIHNAFWIEGGVNVKAGDEASIADWQSWANSIVAEVRIESGQQYDVRVDAFPFLYELLNASAEFAKAGRFCAEIGEGLRLRGTSETDGVAIRIAFEAGGRNDTLLCRGLTLSNTSLFLCLKAAELAQCLERIGVDLDHCLAKFPIGIYKRTIS